MTPSELLEQARLFGSAIDGDVVVYCDIHASGDHVYTVLRRDGRRSEGMHGLTPRQAVGFVASLRCSTAPTDSLVRQWLDGIQRGLDLGARGDL